jgi:hypothetical protein
MILRLLILLALAAVWPALPGCAGGPDQEEDVVTRHRGMLELGYQEFDQTRGQGWRVFAERGAYLDAAQMIAAYVEQSSGLPEVELVTLHFHAAQSYAFSEDVPKALSHLSKARLASEPPDSPVRWNDYMTATAAFLEGDLETLLEARDRIARGTRIGGSPPNLDVVDSLLSHFGEPYAAAYRAHGGVP